VGEQTVELKPEARKNKFRRLPASADNSTRGSRIRALQIAAMSVSYHPAVGFISRMKKIEDRHDDERAGKVIGLLF
jgi:hypothetical protein